MIPAVSIRLLQTQSDERLLASARGGHEPAFEALVHRYRKPLLAHVRRLLPPAKAEDAVQQGLLQAWLALQSGTEVRSVKPWLYRIVHNSALKMQRTADDHAPLSDALATASTPHADLEQRFAAREALAGVAALPALQREALLQTAIDGRTHVQVAATLGLSDGAVRGLLYRARTSLRSAVTALIPFPLVSWSAHVSHNRPPSTEPLELGSAAGGAGIAATLAKGGAIAIAVGALAAGGTALHSKQWPHGPGAAGHTRTRTASRPRADPNRADTTHRPASATGSTTPTAVVPSSNRARRHRQTPPTSGRHAATASPAGLSGRQPALLGAAGNGIGPASATHGGDVSSATGSGGSKGTETSVAPPATSGTQPDNPTTTTTTSNDGSTSNDSNNSNSEANSETGGSGTATPAATETPGTPQTSSSQATNSPASGSDSAPATTGSD
jgi:RNA polymerase sigma factor (sigma-70 family)